jgi:uroporphyrinogen-III decarboxylase
MGDMTSRERMLRAINRQEVDHLPCCFMLFTALIDRADETVGKLVDAELAMGLDSRLLIPPTSRHEQLEHPDLYGLPVRYDPRVTVRQWREYIHGDFDILHKEYMTPAGVLSTSVRLSNDWPHDDRIPFLSDYLVPRSTKRLVTGPDDLEALQYLLAAPAEQDIARFRTEARHARAYAKEQAVLLVGGWGVGTDMTAWLCGMEETIVAAMEQPAFVEDLLEMIHRWEMERMEVVLSAPVDLYIRRGWYEGCDFMTPRFFQKAILPRLKKEAALAHERGAKFANIISSGTVPLLDYYLEAGVDVLIGIDPVQGTHTDMKAIKQKVGHCICLWGGVSGSITVELGSEDEVRAAVREAIGALGPQGFILSPVDNVREVTPVTWRNVDIFINEWRRHW